MTDVEKAEEFAALLSLGPSVLTICKSCECGLTQHVHEQYPDMITLEWVQASCDVDEHGVSGTLMFGDAPEFVFVPWNAIIDARVPRPRQAAPAPAPRLKLIRGGKA